MQLPKRPCVRYGCKALTNGGYCEAHKPKRPSARAQGYDSRWDGYSKAFLRDNPFCCDPFGRHRGQVIRATVTGHKVAHKGNTQMLWDKSNHYPLCSGCNAYQCVTEEGGFGNKAVVKTVGNSSH